MKWIVRVVFSTFAALLLAACATAAAAPPRLVPPCPQPAHQTAAGAAALREPNEPEDCNQAIRGATKDVVRIDYYMMALFCKGEVDPGEVMKQLRQEKKVFLLNKTVAAALGAPLPRVPRMEDLYVLEPTGIERLNNVSKVDPYLSSGGFINAWFGSAGTAGHFDVTGYAIDTLKASNVPGFVGFTEDAEEILQDAAQDPDFFEWFNPAAHAQTDNDTRGRHIDGNWEVAWVRWTQKYLGLAIAAAQKDEPVKALYLIGYALHSVQDLAAHRGRTNAEHSYNARVERDNPDEDPRAIQEAQELTEQILRRLPQLIGANWGKLASLRSFVPPSLRERKGFLQKRKKDMSMEAIFDYWKLAKVFAKLDPCTIQAERIRWCEQGRCEVLLQAILAALVPPRGTL